MNVVHGLFKILNLLSCHLRQPVILDILKESIKAKQVVFCLPKDSLYREGYQLFYKYWDAMSASDSGRARKMVPVRHECHSLLEIRATYYIWEGSETGWSKPTRRPLNTSVKLARPHITSIFILCEPSANSVILGQLMATDSEPIRLF